MRSMKFDMSPFSKYIFLHSILLFSFVLSFGSNPGTGKSIEDFKLLNVDGKLVSLADYPQAKGFVIVFTCNHCPYARLYPQRFNQINEKYKALGVPLIAISSMDTLMYDEDVYREMVEKAKKENFNFPYLIDGSQAVAKNFNAQKTPHAFVIWKENGKWIIKYNGAIDDNAAEASQVQNPYVTNAIDRLLAGKEVELKETQSIGCKIYFRNNKGK